MRSSIELGSFFRACLPHHVNLPPIDEINLMVCPSPISEANYYGNHIR